MKKLLCILVLLAACGETPTQWTRERQAEVTRRDYPNITSTQLARHAETILRLADGNDVQFDFNQNGFSAQRNVSVYFVIGAAQGEYIFVVQTQRSGTGAQIELKIYNNLNSVTAVGVIPSQASLDQSEKAYRLFFSRLDYLTGRADTWLTCDAARSAPLGSGTVESLCLSANDTSPAPR